MDESSRPPAVPGADLLTAVGRHLVIVIVCVLLLGVAGVAYGLLRHEQYTAETRVSIGQLNLSTQGVPGFVYAASQLAAAYAGTIDAPAVTRPAAKAAGISVDAARDALSASSVPDSPLFRVEAETSDRQRSITLANAAARTMLTYVVQINRRAGLRTELLEKLGSAAVIAADLGLAKPKKASLRAKTLARREVARARFEALKGLYALAAGGELAQNLLQVVAPADVAKGDRRPVLERWILTGALAGLVLGIALAGVAEGRERRRRVAAADAVD